jgi:hypothetical protein
MGPPLPQRKRTIFRGTPRRSTERRRKRRPFVDPLTLSVTVGIQVAYTQPSPLSVIVGASVGIAAVTAQLPGQASVGVGVGVQATAYSTSPSGSGNNSASTVGELGTGNHRG